MHDPTFYESESHVFESKVNDLNKDESNLFFAVLSLCFRFF